MSNEEIITKLAELAVTGDLKMKLNVAQHDLTQSSTLELLSKEDDDNILWCVAKHQNTPKEVVNHLANIDNNYSCRVRTTAIKNMAAA